MSGDHDGEFAEDELDEGQEFLNHYESTKFEAEVLVRRAMKAGLPATIYRPGIVVGDSRTGETQKYDGPYILRHLPAPAAPGRARSPASATSTWCGSRSCRATSSSTPWTCSR